MNILIKKAKIIDVSSPFNGTIKDILVDEKNTILKISDTIEQKENATLIYSDKLHISHAWIDIRAYNGEPGFEYKEDNKSFSNAAIKGGFKYVCMRPDTLPKIENRAMVDSVKKNFSSSLISIFPMGSVSKDAKGTELSEMMDMHQSGVTMFYDPLKHLTSDLLKKALLYSQSFNGTIVHMPFDPYLTKKYYVNEGKNAIMHGLQGMPNIAESIIVARDLQILEDVGGRLHFANITTKESLDLIRKYKDKGLHVTADTALQYLILNDSVIGSFNSNYKVFPPFRTQQDIDALIQGVNDHTIDSICTDHSPENIETKSIEFEYASFGISSFDTFYSTYNTFLSDKINLNTFIQKVTKYPSQLINIKLESIQEGNKIYLTCFDPSLTFTLLEKDFYSKSKNNPWLNENLKGKVIEVI